MAFFKQLQDAAVTAVSGFVQNFTLPGSSPYEVQEISSSKLQNLAKCTLLCRDDSLSLYKEATTYFAVLVNPSSPTKAYSLFRLQSETEATTTFSNMSFKLQPLYQSCPTGILYKDALQRFCDVLKSNPTYSCAHLAAALGLRDSFRHPLVLQHLDATDESSQMLPIMVAIDTGNIECIQELIICGAKLDLADAQGNNVFHYAAKCSNSTAIQYLGSKSKTVINQLNLAGEGPLHTACLANLDQNVEHLLRWGADPNLSMSGRFPIHCAMKADSVKCVETLCRWSRDQIHLQDGKYGGSPLHWAKSRECIYTLTELGCNLDSTNKAGETPLHIMVKRHRVECVMGLLAKGANAAIAASHGNNVLHLAIQTDDADLVEMLIVFGSDINYMNTHGHTPRHIASTAKLKNSQDILHLLHKVGATRCPKDSEGCLPGCSANGSFDGISSRKIMSTPEHQKKFLDGMVSDVAMAAAMTRSASATGSAIMTGELTDTSSAAGDRVLSLDGGGIRGLVLIQLLLAIEKAAGQPVSSLFDWIAGTSTGGILALAILHGKPVRYCQGLYFQLKDTVFQGTRPYSSEPLEKFMKKEFGESIRMTEKEYPRVVVTGVLGDRNPTELHFFRNYDPPGIDHEQIYKTAGQFEPPPRPNEQFVWQAARSSGAAPTYFRSFGRFLDGGLMANNPTLDILTEIQEYNMGLSSVGQGGNVRPMHVVVSLGTGRMPPKPVTDNDVYRPEGIFDVFKVAAGAKNLGLMLVEQATQSEGRPVERARAWCTMIHVPFFRFSPQLSDDVALDCKDDMTLIHMLWETQCYIHEHWNKFQQLAALLK